MSDDTSVWGDAWKAANVDGMRPYDEIIRPLFEPFARDLVERVAPAPGSRALDVACGPGTVTRHLARRIGPAGSVVAADISPPMIEIARSRPVDPDAAPITWVESPAAPLPFPDADAQTITCQQGLQFFPDKLAALREARRVLAPGGIAAFAVWSALEQNPFFAVLHAALRDQLSEDLAARYASGPWSLDGPNAEAFAREAGFEDVRVSELTLESPLPAAPVDALIDTLAASGIAAELEHMDSEAAAGLRKAVAHRFDELVGVGATAAPFTTWLLICR